MASHDSIAEAIETTVPNAGTALIHFEIIEEQLERIFSVAITAKRAEEGIDEDNRNLVLIHLLGLIADIAGNASSVHPVRDFLAALSDAEIAAYEASKGVSNG